MGRIKTMKIKAVTNKLFANHSDVLTNDFSKNKAIIAEYVDIPSKKLRNVIAGYATRLKKTQEVL